MKVPLDHLQNISLKQTVDGTYKAEDKLTEFAEIHLKSKNEVKNLLTVAIAYS